MVVEAATKELTPVEKSETCELVMERLESVVMEATEVVAAKLVTKFEVARGVVKYRLLPSASAVVVVAARFCAKFEVARDWVKYRFDNPSSTPSVVVAKNSDAVSFALSAFCKSV